MFDRLSCDPTIRYRLKAWLFDADKMDAVDALNDAEDLVEVLQKRVDEQVELGNEVLEEILAEETKETIEKLKTALKEMRRVFNQSPTLISVEKVEALNLAARALLD